MPLKQKINPGKRKANILKKSIQSRPYPTILLMSAISFTISITRMVTNAAKNIDVRIINNVANIFLPFVFLFC
jgi:hypothetical protein